MKHKLFILAGLVLPLSLVSCGSGTKLINTATYTRMDAPAYVTPVQVDLDVNPVKIEYFMIVGSSVRIGGYDNVVATAVKEALDANGGGDVLVGLQTQAKYAENGEIESINISGYPAKYVNFRSNENLLKTDTQAVSTAATVESPLKRIKK